MSWDSLHALSSELASKAELALRGNERELALNYYQKAAEYEQQALSELSFSLPRTRGIIAVSAAWLWYKGRGFAQAMGIARSELDAGHLPDFAIQQLNELLAVLGTGNNGSGEEITVIDLGPVSDTGFPEGSLVT